MKVLKNQMFSVFKLARIMFRRVFILFLIVVIFISLPLSFALAQTSSERQSALDGKLYKPEAYQKLLNSLHKDYPQYSEESIVSYVFWAYNDLKNYFSNVTLYDVMTGIFEFSRLMQRSETIEALEGSKKLEKLISLYLIMKEEDSEKIAAPDI